MKTVLVEGPENPVLSTDEAKEHIRALSGTDEDTYIDLLVLGATRTAESYTNRKFITQTWKIFYDEFPCYVIDLPFGNVQSVSWIKYYDENGDLQTLSTDDYQVDLGTPCRVKPSILDAAWPVTQCEKFSAVEIQFVCGYGDAGSDVPEDIRNAIRLIVGDLYSQREDSTKINVVARSLLDFYRLMDF